MGKQKKNSKHKHFFDNIKKKISIHQMKVLNINKNKNYISKQTKLNRCHFNSFLYFLQFKSDFEITALHCYRLV